MSEPSQQAAATASPKTTIKIGDESYRIDLSKISNLSSFVDSQTSAQPQTIEFVHSPVPLFNVALEGIEFGYRQCFRSLPASLAHHRTLCDTYDLLGLDILSGQSLNEIVRDLKSGQARHEGENNHYHHHHHHHREIKADKSKARDAAFKLLYLILTAEFKDEDEVRDGVQVFNAVLYLVSRPAVFKWKTRKVVCAAYEGRFHVSFRQRLRLDEWAKEDKAKSPEEEDLEDVTTDEGSDGCPDNY